MYVIVNVGKPLWPSTTCPPEWFFVLPGKEPHTYGTLDEAARELAELMEEYGHTLDTAPIFRLEPVPSGEVEAALKRVRECLEA